MLLKGLLTIALISWAITASAGTITLTVADNIATVSTTYSVSNGDIARAKAAIIAANHMDAPAPQVVIDKLAEMFFNIMQAYTLKQERETASTAAVVAISPIAGTKQ